MHLLYCLQSTGCDVEGLNTEMGGGAKTEVGGAQPPCEFRTLTTGYAGLKSGHVIVIIFSVIVDYRPHLYFDAVSTARMMMIMMMMTGR